MSKKFQISVRTVERILSGRAYSDVPEDWLSSNASDVRELLQAVEEYEQSLFDRVMSEF